IIGDVDTVGSAWPRIHLQYSPALNQLSLTRRKLTSQIERLEEQKQELEQQLQAAEIIKADLEERYQQGEQSLEVAIDNLARANAQIDLIKDMLQVEPAT
ncbi:hypothetical protein N9U42_02645, partial [Luminiphilus sp.]